MRGLDSVAHTPEIDSFMTDSCIIKMGGRRHHVAIDGEIVAHSMPLTYRIAKDSLRLVIPARDAAASAE